MIKKQHHFLFLIGVLFCFSTTYAQTLSTEINRDSIKIGEEILYEIKVSADNQPDSLAFPKGQSFVPVELIKDYQRDTISLKPKFELIKKYGISAYDSGRYTIPQQLVQIDGQKLLTDSLSIYVNTVEVDTTSKEFYPTKQSVDVPQPLELSDWIWYTIAILLLLLLLVGVYFHFKRRRDQSKKRKPPYEQAIDSLKALDHSQLIDERNFKEYYSKLTEISRRYLEEKVSIRAMEFTSNELVDHLKKQMNSGKLKLNDDLIQDFEKILKRADMAKFARQQPDMITAKDDRKNVEQFTNTVQNSIPEPTEEEKKRDKAYQNKLARRRKRLKIAAIAIVVIGTLSISTSYLIATKGFDYVKEIVIGSPTKDILKKDWITSGYGFPPLNITTPEVLVRKNADSLKISGLQKPNAAYFTYGNLYGNVKVILANVPVEDGSVEALKENTKEIYNKLESLGAYNIMTKEREFETVNGVKGPEVYGNFSVENPITGNDIEKDYRLINFVYKKGFYQVIVVTKADDEYANEITNRIVNSIEFKSE